MYTFISIDSLYIYIANVKSKLKHVCCYLEFHTSRRSSDNSSDYPQIGQRHESLSNDEQDFSLTKGQCSNVRLYYPYHPYTNLFIFQFVSLLCLRSTLRTYIYIIYIFILGYYDHVSVLRS